MWNLENLLKQGFEVKPLFPLSVADPEEKKIVPHYPIPDPPMIINFRLTNGHWQLQSIMPLYCIIIFQDATLGSQYSGLGFSWSAPFFPPLRFLFCLPIPLNCCFFNWFFSSYANYGLVLCKRCWEATTIWRGSIFLIQQFILIKYFYLMGVFVRIKIHKMHRITEFLIYFPKVGNGYCLALLW